MASTNNFAATPRIGCALVTLASTDLTTPANPVSVFVAGTSGSVINRIDICGAGASTTAGSIQLFWYDGTNYRIWKSVDVDAVTVAAGTPPFQATLLFPEGLPVPSSSGGTLFDELRASSYVAEAFVITAYGGDL